MREVIDWLNTKVVFPLSLVILLLLGYFKGEIDDIREESNKLEEKLEQKVDNQIYRRDVDVIRDDMKSIREGVDWLIRESRNGSDKNT